MKNIHNVGLFFLACLLSTPLTSHGLDLKLAPKGSQVFENSYHMTVNATCKIQCHETDTIQIRMTTHQGSINGKSLSDGQTTSLSVHNNDSITVSAEPGAKVNLVNLGNGPVLANCSI